MFCPRFDYLLVQSHKYVWTVENIFETTWHRTGVDVPACCRIVSHKFSICVQLSRLGLGVWFFLRVEEVPSSILGADHFITLSSSFCFNTKSKLPIYLHFFVENATSITISWSPKNTNTHVVLFSTWGSYQNSPTNF